MNRLERDQAVLIYRHRSLLALSKRVSEGHLRRDTARNLLPYVEKLISICSKQIECEQIKARIGNADRFYSQAYELIRSTDAIPREKVDEQDAQARASVEVLKGLLAEKQMEAEAIRIRIAKEAVEILNSLEILDLKCDRLLLSGLPDRNVGVVRNDVREAGQQTRFRPNGRTTIDSNSRGKLLAHTKVQKES